MFTIRTFFCKILEQLDKIVYLTDIKLFVSKSDYRRVNRGELYFKNPI